MFGLSNNLVLVTDSILSLYVLCRWVEFTDKRVAKKVANMLNGEQIGKLLFKYTCFVYDILARYTISTLFWGWWKSLHWAGLLGFIVIFPIGKLWMWPLFFLYLKATALGVGEGMLEFGVAILWRDSRVSCFFVVFVTLLP